MRTNYFFQSELMSSQIRCYLIFCGGGGGGGGGKKIGVTHNGLKHILVLEFLKFHKWLQATKQHKFNRTNAQTP